jgi:hypothetical protein
MTSPQLSAPLTFAVRPSLTRRLIGGLAIAATFPYLVLKLVWIAGGTVGVTDQKFVHDGSVLTLNVLTLGLDALAIVVALALTYGWGSRHAAWPVLLPAWIATGLLAPIAVTMPIATAGSLFTPTFEGGGPLRPWVFVLVYGGFTAQGVGLSAAFAAYARERWAWVFRSRTSEGTPGPTREIQRFGAGVTVVIMAVVATAHLYWAAGGGHQADRTYTTYLVQALYGVLAIATAAGLLTMVRRRAHVRLWIPLTATWLGAGAMFAWGGWGMLNMLLGSALAQGGHAGPAIDLLQLLGGLIAAMTGIVRLAGGPWRSRADRQG